MVKKAVRGALNLQTMLAPETVRAKACVRDWEEAAELTGRLLWRKGAILPSYIAAMKRSLQEIGPYMVIAPGTALLHARPEDGVLQPCLALVTLSLPVPFGHSENDPVDIVIAMGAVDKQAHIKALQELAVLLGDERKVAYIRSAACDAELYAALSLPGIS